MSIEPGLKAELVHVVVETDTAESYGSGLVPVLSTPHLIALMESAAQSAIAPHLQEGQTAVGVHVNMRHLAATPVGMQVWIQAELIEVNGRRLRFYIEAYDNTERVGEAEHERVIIDRARFLAGVTRKVCPNEGT